MTQEIYPNSLLTGSIQIFFLLFLTIAGLYFAQEFLIPLTIGGLLATLLLPTCHWLQKKKISRIIASFLCLLILLLGIGGIGTLLGWQIAELINDIAQVKEKAVDSFRHIQQFIFNHFNISLKEQSQILNNQQNAIGGMISSLASSLTYVLTRFALTLVYTFLLLYYRAHIKTFLLQLSPVSQRKETEQVILSATHVSQQYLIGLSKMIFCLWVMYGIGFSLLGIKNPWLFAILCGLLEIIPFIGNLTGTVITASVAAVDGASAGILFGVVAIYATVQFIQGWLLEPLILGPQVKINPLFTIIALVLGEIVWGIPGVVLAIPLTAVVKIVCDHIEPLKPYGSLIGGVKKEKKIKRRSN